MVDPSVNSIGVDTGNDVICQRVVRIAQQDQKLIAAQPHDSILLAYMPGQKAPHALEHFITALLPAGVVDLLEVIPTDHDTARALGTVLGEQLHGFRITVIVDDAQEVDAKVRVQLGTNEIGEWSTSDRPAVLIWRRSATPSRSSAPRFSIA